MTRARRIDTEFRRCPYGPPQSTYCALADGFPRLENETAVDDAAAFLSWNGEKLFGVKWQNFKLALVEQKYLTDPALPLGFPKIMNLVTDPKEREPYNQAYLHTWTLAHFGRRMKAFAVRVHREPLIPAGAPLDFVPKAAPKREVTGAVS